MSDYQKLSSMSMHSINIDIFFFTQLSKSATTFKMPNIRGPSQDTPHHVMSSKHGDNCIQMSGKILTYAVL